MKKLVVLLAALSLLSACSKKEETVAEKIAKLKKDRAALDTKIRDLEAKSGMKDSVKAVPVSVAVVQPQPFSSYIDVQAAIAGDDNVLATPQAPGTIRRVLVHVGQKVARGQTLAVLDAGPVTQQVAALDAQIAAQDAQVSLLKTLYEKQQRLWAQQIGTEVQLLSAKTAYEAALKQRAGLSSQRAGTASQRDMYRIISPIAGTVDAVDVKDGDAASPGTRGIRVVNASKLKAEAKLGEGYLGKVKVGDPVTLIFTDLGDSMKTHLTFVSQGVDPLSRAFDVQIALGSYPRLHPNMSARMKIANYESRNAMVVPVAAVQQTGAGPMVFVADGKMAKAVPVQTGRTADGNVEILGGLAAGDKVVTAGYEDLDNGTVIVVQ